MHIREMIIWLEIGQLFRQYYIRSPILFDTKHTANDGEWISAVLLSTGVTFSVLVRLFV